jgi:hypothetical protein
MDGPGPADLRKVGGVGEETAAKYGAEILAALAGGGAGWSAASGRGRSGEAEARDAAEGTGGKDAADGKEVEGSPL